MALVPPGGINRRFREISFNLGFDLDTVEIPFAMLG
jgi:hypothetical protein